jgi:hypothetical protein
LGSIPIVEKTGGHENWQDLPIYFIDSIYDIDKFTEESLSKKYEEMMDKDYRYDKLTIDDWMNQCREVENKLLYK